MASVRSVNPEATTSVEENDTNRLQPTMDSVKDVCKFARVLVLGAASSGVGKSSLINQVFRIDGDVLQHALPQISSLKPGTADINREFSSPQNPNLRFHDSEGYEAGDIGKFETLQKFIVERSLKDISPSDRVHVVWHCVSTPINGSRLLQSGDNKIFQLCTKHQVPIVVVFTKFDGLVTSKEKDLFEQNLGLNKETLIERAKEIAAASFEKDCDALIERAKANGVPYIFVSTNKGYEDTISQLVQRTLSCIDVSPPDTAQTKKKPWYAVGHLLRPSSKSRPTETTPQKTKAMAVMMASAQRVDKVTKVQYCICVGKNKYWRGLWSGVNFLGRDLSKCLYVLHYDIVEFWNLAEEEPHYLITDAFAAKMTCLVEDLSEPKTKSGNQLRELAGDVSNVTGAIAGVAGLASAAVNPAVTIPIAAVIVFAAWAYGVYRATPPILRCFMAYIVDLVIIMHRLFVAGQPIKSGTVTQTLTDFEETKAEIHREIKAFVAELGVLGAITGKDKVIGKIEELIVQNTNGTTDSNH